MGFGGENDDRPPMSSVLWADTFRELIMRVTTVDLDPKLGYLSSTSSAPNEVAVEMVINAADGFWYFPLAAENLVWLVIVCA